MGRIRDYGCGVLVLGVVAHWQHAGSRVRPRAPVPFFCIHGDVACMGCFVFAVWSRSAVPRCVLRVRDDPVRPALKGWIPENRLMQKVSIVTISFNQAPFLERAIRSVVEQDYPDVEYIVVDPGSTDGSRDIIERYRSRISKIILEPDTAPANGLNKGFAATRGQIFFYTNTHPA